MATCTFTSAGTDNLWSNAANWDSAPVDGDAVVITSGETCEFDADLSSWVTGVAGITLTGSTFYLTRTPGTYYFLLKASASITGVGGVFDCGTSGDQVPFGVKFTFKSGTSSYFTTQVTLNIYGQNPATKQVKLTASAAVSATVLSVDIDVTGDLWADGNDIGIDTERVAGVSKCEDKVIAASGITSTTITLTTGLSYAKNEGDIISLLSRHLRFDGNPNCFNVSTASSMQGMWLSVIAGGWLMAVEGGDGVYTGGSYGYYVKSNITVSAGIWRNNPNFFHSGRSCSITGGYIGNCTTVFNTGSGHILSGGLIVGCGTIFNSCAGLYISGGDAWGNWVIMAYCSAAGSGFDIGENAYSMYSTPFTFYGATIYNFLNVNYQNMPTQIYSEWYDYDGVAGAYKSWTSGGVTTKQATTYPTGYDYSMQTVLASATSEGYYQTDVIIPAGSSVDMNIFLRKSASMTYLPRAIVFNKNGSDPFAGGTALHTFTMTDSIDTWESDNYVYTNSTSETVILAVRCQGKNASDNLFSLVDINIINVDLTSTLAKLDTIDTVVDSIKAKTDTLKNPSLLIDGEIII